MNSKGKELYLKYIQFNKNIFILNFVTLYKLCTNVIRNIHYIHVVFLKLPMIGFGLILNWIFLLTIALIMYSVCFSSVELSVVTFWLITFSKTAIGFSNLTSFPCKTWWPIMNIGIP